MLYFWMNIPQEVLPLANPVDPAHERDKRSAAITYLISSTGASGSRVVEIPHGRMVIHPTISWPVFNWTLPSSFAPGALTQMAKAMSERGLKPSFAVIEDEVTPEDAAALTSMGLKPGERHVIMLADPEELDEERQWQADHLAEPFHIEVKQVVPSQEWLDLLLDGFEVPGPARPRFCRAHSVLTKGDPRSLPFEATVDGARAGASFLWVDGGTAGLHTAAVLPKFRGIGVHRAMFGARVREVLRIDRDGVQSVNWIATETAIPSVERTAAFFGLRVALSYRFWF